MNPFFQKWSQKYFRVVDIIDNSINSQFFIFDMYRYLNNIEKEIYQNIDFIFTSSGPEFVGILDKEFVVIMDTEGNIAFCCKYWQQFPFGVLDDENDSFDFIEDLHKNQKMFYQYNSNEGEGSYVGKYKDKESYIKYIENKYGKFSSFSWFSNI